MAQLILAVHSGIHDAGAAVFEGYSVKAAVQLERLTRFKGDGRCYPDRSIDEVLTIAGAERRDVDVVTLGRAELPTRFYRNIRGVRWLREQYRQLVEGNDRRYMMREHYRYHTARTDDIFDIDKFKRGGGFRQDTLVHFYNHHEAHALPCVFYRT
jgi:carbamoyltransferase